MVKKSTTKKKKKIDPLIEFLLKVKKSEGVVVCAPNKLKDEIQAHKYTATGKLNATDKLRKQEVFKYLLRKETREYTTKGKGKTKAKKYTINFYALSDKGKNILVAHRLEQEAAKKNELEKLNGLEALLIQHSEDKENIITAIKKLPENQNVVENKIEDSMTILEKNISSKINDFCSHITQEISNFKKNIFEDLQSSIQINLERQITQLNATTNELKVCYSQHQNEEDFLASSIKEYLTREREKISEEFRATNIANGSFLQMEQNIEKYLMPLLSRDRYKKIPNLYREISKKGIDVSPGYFNDILISLKNKQKIALGDWNNSHEEIEYQHVIYRENLYYFIIKGKKA